jgi:tRNA 2-thiouridine synthesizing protein A
VVPREFFGKEVTMAVVVLNTTGLRCPQPVLKIAVKAPSMKPGDVLEVVGDCSSFERDIRTWCERLKKTLLAVNDNGNGSKKIQIKF